MYNAEKKRMPYGSWDSPLSAKIVAKGSVRIGDLHVSNDECFWIEGRSSEGGRGVVVKYCDGCHYVDLTPSEFNVRTGVHEYGGGAIAVHGETVFFSNWGDHRVYRHDRGGSPFAISPKSKDGANVRYADFDVSPDGKILYCVRETHSGAESEPTNEVVAIPSDGSAEPKLLLSGRDFFAAPRVSPDGTQIAWLAWDHPNMPWDAAELWVADLVDNDVAKDRKLAGGNSESTAQPEWSPNGTLHCVSDRTGWWNLYAFKNGKVTPIAPMNAEWAEPAWVFGLSRYGFLSDGTVVGAPIGLKAGSLGVVSKGKFVPLPNDYSSIAYLKCEGDSVWFVGAGTHKKPEVCKMNALSKEVSVLRRMEGFTIDAAYISPPEEISFGTTDEGTAYAFLYMPKNPLYEGIIDERPPLIVISHGGPTSAAHPTLDFAKQFWTTRGFAVVDVNYRGSSGYGREYRNALRGRWGIYDVDDCAAAAKQAENLGRADGKRLIIRGGSAGGYTTLCALAFLDLFSAGASYYGVADAEELAKDTHKFESRYLDSLIAPYPAEVEEYRKRSPLHFASEITCPVILFQGEEDKVVPREQADAIAERLEVARVPYAYVLFPQEQHGFRKAETIVRSLEAELYFYGKVFGFEPAGNPRGVEVKNWK